MSKSPRHKLNKTDKRLLDTLVAAGYEHDKARDLIQKQVYTLTLADQRHVVSEISNGVNPTQAYSAVYQARRIRLARKYLNGKRLWKKPGKIRPHQRKDFFCRSRDSSFLRKSSLFWASLVPARDALNSSI